MSTIFKKFILYQNNSIIESNNRILCEIEEAGDVRITMLHKKELLEAGYEIPDNNMHEKETKLSSCNENELSVNVTNNIDEWSEESTRFVLDKYAEYLEVAGPMKKLKNKKMIRMNTNDLETFLNIQKTYIQCENRYKTILRRKCICIKNNSTSGSKRAKISYENEIKQIAAKDDSLEPEIIQSANNTEINVKRTTLLQKSKPKNNTTKSKLLETLIEIYKEKENKNKNDMKRK
ncbi:hypothetical protein PUN28_017001 [Cardiocondyla obscurior]|uniref:Uncharacterized protein n=1 Tax=Cardiocondyla obscurior TaxID=286306 RepID=A0AAW2EQ89_9HYME